ncbi:heparan-alpha-glucosaminide N-acetyltransferase domain-containing protein [Sphingomonas sp.]|uniref:DUF1624 domain-containing protein n=1 Tax=Sphingomonas sp. TaxID=28214 RepID=UPI001B0A462E|nr:heparan-alpha-glucosaminide N-acetyltransferase domain-containing protein [Sphingomonas sp.]MBO9711539.1 DUF1624 domain-containing protein [Sphingomonas sp.]
MATAAAPFEEDPLTEPAENAGRTRSGAARLDAIDMLRGLVIAIMVLDHVRDFFHIEALQFDPVDPLRSYPALFFTRWITHLCAPTFVFLAGVSIFFQKANGKTGWDLSRFLLTRGLWLVLLEVTVVTFGFNFGEPFVFLQVIWAIGGSMVCMAALARLGPRTVLAIGVAILALYPLGTLALLNVQGGPLLPLKILFVPTVLPPYLLAYYALVPWLGVMCLGFGLGPLFRMAPEARGRRLLWLALAMLAAFALLRTLNGYGDFFPWKAGATTAQSVMSWLNVSKYPPSEDYVLATLGVSLLLFLALGHLRGPLARVLLDFGRTPLFTYLAHLYIAHGLMLAVVLATGAPAGTAFNTVSGSLGPVPPPAWGFSLPVVYLVWLLVLAVLVPLSRWFAGVKRGRRDWWLSYI